MSKASKILSKSQPAAPQKPQGPNPQLFMEMAGNRLAEISDHLADLSTLIYENQDPQADHNAMLAGIRELVSHYSLQIGQIASSMKGGDA